MPPATAPRIFRPHRHTAVLPIWKQRYEAVNEKYMELKQKAQPFLDAIEIASERVWAFVHAILARGKETQEHKHPARKRRQDMEI